MVEKFKNLSFPIKFGLAILVPPLTCVACAYLYNFLLNRGCRATVSGCEMETIIPFLFVFAAELPFFLLLIPWLSSQGSATTTSGVLDLFYPGRKLLLTIIPALTLWFIIGYLMGKVCKRFSPKIQKGCLALLVVVPIAGLLLLTVQLLLGWWI